MVPCGPMISDALIKIKNEIDRALTFPGTGLPRVSGGFLRNEHRRESIRLPVPMAWTR